MGARHRREPKPRRRRRKLRRSRKKAIEIEQYLVELPVVPPPLEERPLVYEGQVRCPAKLFATIARDACLRAQNSVGCNCLTGQAAKAERMAYDVEQLREEKIAAAVRKRHHEQYVRWGKKWKPTGRPRGRPPRLPDGSKGIPKQRVKCPPWRDEDAK